MLAVFQEKIDSSVKKEWLEKHLTQWQEIKSELLYFPEKLEKRQEGLFLIYPSLEGKLLSEEVRPLSLWEKVDCFLCTLKGLQIWHEAGWLYPDLGRERIWVTRKREEIHFLLLPSREEKGQNPFYKAPERWGLWESKADFRSDLYEWGAFFYGFFSGTPAFSGEREEDIRYGHLTRVPARPSLHYPAIPTVLDNLLLKLLAKEPEGRYQSIKSLIRDLEQIRQTRGKENFALDLTDLRQEVFSEEKIGYEKELSQCVEAYKRRARERDSEILVISGDSGTGKSTLASRMKEEILWESGISWGEFKGEPEHCQKPFWGLRKIMESYAQEETFWEKYSLKEKEKEKKNFQRDKSGSWEALEIFQEKKEKQVWRYKEIVGEIFHKKPQGVLFFDDFQWLDQESRDFLPFLGSLCKNFDILIVLAHRSEAALTLGSQISYEKIHISGLDKEAVRKFLERAIGQELAREIEEKVFQVSMGNPFYLRCVMYELLEQGYLVKNGVRWQLKEGWEEYQFQKDAGELLYKRLERLSKEESAILQIASCVGRQFTLCFFYDLYQFLLDGKGDWGKLVKNLDNLVESQFLNMQRETGKIIYTFAHDKIQEVIGKKISLKKRREYHLGCARILEKRAGANIYQLAYHYNFTTVAEKKLLYNKLSFEKARESQSLKESVFYLQCLLELVSEQNFTEWSGYVLQLIHSLQMLAEFSEADKWLLRLESQMVRGKDNLLQGKIYLARGLNCYYRNQIKEAEKYLLDSLELAEKNERELVPFINRLLGSVSFFGSKQKEALYYLSEAEKQEGNSQARLVIWGMRSWVFNRLGRFEESGRDVKKIEKELSSIQSLLQLAQLYHLCSQYYVWSAEDRELGLFYAQESLRYARESHYDIFIFSALFGMVTVYGFLGRFEEAEGAFQEAIKLSKERQISIGLGILYARVAENYLLEGRLEDAHRIVLEQLSSENKGDRVAQAVFSRVRGLYEFSLGKKVEALYWSHKAFEMAKQEEAITAQIMCLGQLQFLYEKTGKIKEGKGYAQKIQSMCENNPPLVFHAQRIKRELQLFSAGGVEKKEISFEEENKSGLHKKIWEIFSQLLIKEREKEDFERDFLREIKKLNGAEFAYFFKAQREPKEILIFPEGKGIPAELGDICRELLVRERGICKNEAGSLKNQKIRSVLTVPIRWGKAILGGLIFGSTHLGGLFSHAELEFYEALGVQLAVVWERYGERGPQGRINDENKLDLFVIRYQISKKELEIVKNLMDGLTNNEIAQNKNISYHTVRRHLENIYRKTGARSRQELLNLL